MDTEAFVDKQSIVRKIWGRGDTVLLVFAGGSAEFALNKAVDWLYFTGRLPADPLGRLFSTVSYAQRIVFASREEALASIDCISAIHRGVEEKRGRSIPDAAYLDVLFMLIDYSIRSFELLERKLNEAEKSEVFGVFHRIGSRMGLKGLPDSYGDWVILRARYLREDLVSSDFTIDLYRQYRKHLGAFRYRLLSEVQILLVPERVKELLEVVGLFGGSVGPEGGFPGGKLPLLLPAYKVVRFLGLDRALKTVLLPGKYRAEALKLDSRQG